MIATVAFAIVAGLMAKATAQVATVAIRESRLFSDARFQVATEKSLQRQYRLAPSAASRMGHTEAERQLSDDLRRATPSPAGTRALQAAGRYAAAAERLFAALDAQDARRAQAIEAGEADPAYAVLRSEVGTLATASIERADGALIVLREVEDTILGFTSGVSLVAMVLLVIVMLILRHYRRIVNETMNAELNRFKKASLTDYLTGLGNHRAYQEDLSRNIAEAAETGTVVTIALIDVDELKVLNDRNGHVHGDRLLSSLAQVLRAADLTSVPYRLGGDEFALAFAGMTSDVAKVRMEEVRRVVEARMNGTTVSIGISTTSPDEPDLLVVREQADAALYEAKRRGRNTVVTFDEIRDEHPVFLPARVEEVRRLIADGTMGVAFQPIWSIDHRTVIGYEALARPGGGDPINPQDAFDIAERIGKAHELDRVCRNAILSRAESLPSDALLFLNVSPQTLDHGELPGSTLVHAVEAAGLTPERVVLEITERSIARLDVVVREAARLRALGFMLALDDAGSGNSGLEMLSKLHVDFVKIDRDVIVRALAGAGGRGVLAGIIAIAHEMHAQIIAEGIEDQAMLELIRGATRSSPVDCAVQGYYLGRPQHDFVDDHEEQVVVRRLGAGMLDPRLTEAKAS
ncbi:MAG TPA: bifunctional diguanylate cyclase/phosphodiesterase [Candidatus Elarobacter sp.]|nr:bifunctional diguanylate cyclase/phosphodiesterase [Candidatus Elarobacter sp.]